MSEEKYDRRKAVEYAKQWATGRNPQYYDYSRLGGDCTNFVSQCIYAGSGIMNMKIPYGWYYTGPNDHSASWTGVTYLYDFLTRKTGIGPIGTEVSLEEVQEGDVAQTQNSGKGFSHSQIILSTGKTPDMNTILVAAHTVDSLNRPLSSYQFQKIRFIHIYAVKKN